MSTEQHESLRIAEQLKTNVFHSVGIDRAAAETIRSQHALIVQMAEALSDLHAMAERYRPPGYSAPVAQKKAAYAIAAATQYLKGPKT